MSDHVNPHARRELGVDFAPGRDIRIDPTVWQTRGLTPREAKVLAAVLTVAANVAVKPDPADGWTFPEKDR